MIIDKKNVRIDFRKNNGVPVWKDVPLDEVPYWYYYAVCMDDNDENYNEKVLIGTATKDELIDLALQCSIDNEKMLFVAYPRKSKHTNWIYKFLEYDEETDTMLIRVSKNDYSTIFFTFTDSNLCRLTVSSNVPGYMEIAAQYEMLKDHKTPVLHVPKHNPLYNVYYRAKRMADEYWRRLREQKQYLGNAT